MRVLAVLSIIAFGIACGPPVQPIQYVQTGSDSGPEMNPPDSGNHSDSGPGHDAGPAHDAGPGHDAGPAFDAGPPIDAGPICNGECPGIGATRCVGNGVETCGQGQGTCLAWGSASDCGSLTCSDGTCSSTCTNQCGNPGEVQCNGNTVQVCEAANGCLVWDDAATCSNGETCTNGACISACTNQCGNAGSTQCVGASIQICEETSGGCLDWSQATSCGPGNTCSSGACVSSCQNQCSSSGQTKCVGTEVETCVLLANGCFAWGAETSCGTNATCSGSACVATSQATIGSPCTADTNCTVGPSPACETAADDFPDGYCISGCTTTTDCGTNSVCVSGLASTDYCFESCASNTDCRPGYFCGSLNSLDFCYPMCTSNAECGTGETCDFSTGICQTATTSTYPATFPTPPQVVDSGGPTLSSPYIVPIFFSNDVDSATVTSLKGFYSGIGTSQFWAPATEYGVGTATSASPVTLAASANTVNDTFAAGSDVWTLLNNAIAARSIPAPTSNTIYVLNFPESTTINAGTAASCVAFGGYHAEMDNAGQNPVAYAIVPRCPPPSGWTELQLTSGAASHELIEASTDPNPFTNPAYEQIDAAHFEWNATFDESEVGDLCFLDPEAFFQFSDFPYVVQRYWSNASIAAGRDPGQPEEPGEVFFYSVPEMSDTISYPVNNTTVQVTGVSVAVGSSKTIPVVLYSEAATTGTWTVSALDWNTLMNQSADLSFSWDSTSGENGTQLNLTITPQTAGAGNVDVFYIVSTMTVNGTSVSHYSIGIVGE